MSLTGLAANKILKFDGTKWALSDDATGGAPSDATTNSKGIMQVGAGLGVAAAVVSVTYGSSADTAAQGNDVRLSDSRAPNGAAGGALSGTYPNPTIAAGAVGATQLADGGVSAAKIANSAVDANKIASGAISNTHINSSAAIAASTLAAGTDKQVMTTSGSTPAWVSPNAVIHQRSCDTGNANDVMVPVGSWCVDKYEASICDSLAGTGSCYFADSSVLDVQYPNVANLPASFARDGSGSSAVYAISKPAVIPARGMTWYQASVACALSGKQLIPDSIWQLAAIGTFDPGDVSGTGGTSGGSAIDAAAAKCNTLTAGATTDNDGNGLWTDLANHVRPTARSGVTTAGANACISRFVVEDMVGNFGSGRI